MEITHNGKRYRVKDESAYYDFFERMVNRFPSELIETKPEEKPTEEEDKIEILIEEIADCFDGDNLSYHAGKIRGLLSDLIDDHDKAMEIPEVPEYLEKQIELITNSLNAVIKKINNL